VPSLRRARSRRPLLASRSPDPRRHPLPDAPAALLRLHPDRRLALRDLLGRSPLGRSPLGRSPLGRSPLGRSPLGRGPLGRGPLGRSPLGCGPLGRSPLGCGPLGRSPLGRSQPPLAVLSFSFLPLAKPWKKDVCQVFPGLWGCCNPGFFCPYYSCVCRYHRDCCRDCNKTCCP
jgi:hypothetical protein